MKLGGVSCFLLVLGLIACGGGVKPAPAGPGPVLVEVVNEPVISTPGPTATSYPTFTPGPTLTPVSPSVTIPAASPVPAGVPRSVVTVLRDQGDSSYVPAGTVVVALAVTPVFLPAPGPVETTPVVPVLSGTPVPAPAPTPYGYLPYRAVEEGGDGLEDGDGPEAGGARFVHQTLFPFQSSEIPDVFTTGLPGDLPLMANFISAGSRFVVWAVIYDVSGAPEGWSMDGMVRWSDVTEDDGIPDFIVYEAPVSLHDRAPVTLDDDTYMFLEGLGRRLPGFWQPGTYRVEFLDGDGKEVVSWVFDVR